MLFIAPPSSPIVTAFTDNDASKEVRRVRLESGLKRIFGESPDQRNAEIENLLDVVDNLNVGETEPVTRYISEHHDEMRPSFYLVSDPGLGFGGKRLGIWCNDDIAMMYRYTHAAKNIRYHVGGVMWEDKGFDGSCRLEIRFHDDGKLRDIALFAFDHDDNRVLFSEGKTLDEFWVKTLETIK